MVLKPGSRDFLWMLTGAVGLLVVMLVLLRFHGENSPVEQLASKAKRVDLVERMEASLAKASEAEKRAVLAITDQDSQAYADEARAAAAEIERQRKELAGLLSSNGIRGETELLEQFNEAFIRYQEVDREVLDLAVKNTNLKAYALAFGPAAEAVGDLDDALTRVSVKSSLSPVAAVTLHALSAKTAVLRIQALLPPHIAEESDKKMDELEARMAAQDKQARAELAALKGIEGLGGDKDLAAASEAYDRFTKLRTQILALSRENTNVRSLTISLNQKRKATVACQETLAALREKILGEPIAGVNYGHVTSPR